MTNTTFKDQTNLLEKINRAIPNSIYIFDVVEQSMVWFNERVQAMYGYSVEEVRAMGPDYWAQTMHPDDIPYLAESLAKVLSLKDGEVIELEYRFKDQKGEYHWLSDRVTVFTRDTEGKVLSLLGVATDIDDRKAYEETLKKTIEKLNMSLGAANMGTWEWDVLQESARWDARMYQIHSGESNMEANALAEFRKRIHKEDAEIVQQRFDEAVRLKQDVYLTYRVTWDNGEIHHVRCYGRFLSPGQDSRIYGVCWDSTEEIQTERQIEEARAKLIANTKMAALGEMSGGIAHEINNPLTVIQARAFQLTQMVESGRPDTEKIKQAAESISRTADKIAKIVKSLRSFSREGSNDPFDIVSVKEIISETLEFCRTRFYNHGVDIVVEEVDEELEIECRLVQIEQVLLNLLNNSFDAIQELEEKWIQVKVEAQDEYIDIKVIDSGIGISEEEAEKIMLPFFTTKEVGKGTGLGLSISSGIVKSHNGELFLEPRTKNTTFVIRVPRLQQNPE
ncbi:PAS domain-containing sensor histidine kinase [Bdellovibrio svalbardensis]|uniref:histidine kinase n=1 Tax=Bdellovibrio svalbardensis TaxID=2972972 RepID=A0ABT6DKI9_9BACT|nr:PAS domain-containing protein [Bdellovibrio svalbardensis]MDG0817379.1 PAS domain-containing protein [Bdellovibrio svalbardensis]